MGYDKPLSKPVTGVSAAHTIYVCFRACMCIQRHAACMYSSAHVGIFIGMCMLFTIPRIGNVNYGIKHTAWYT